MIADRQREIDDFIREHWPKPQLSAQPNHNGCHDLSDDDVLRMCREAKNGAKFRALFVGDASGYPSPSEADSAFLWLMTFYTQDRAQLERLWRRSALWRGKAEKRPDYVERTITGAMGRAEFSEPAGSGPTINGRRAGGNGTGANSRNGATDDADTDRAGNFGSAADRDNAAESTEAPWPDRAPLPTEHVPVPTMPDRMVPEPFRAWLADIADLSKLPLEMVAAPAITAAGAVIGRSVGIRPNKFDDFTTVPNHWGAGVARPGLIKTDTFNRALRPLGRLAAAAQAEWEKTEEANDITRERLQAEIDAIKSRMREAAKQARKPKPQAETKTDEAASPGSLKDELGGLEDELKKKKMALRAATTTPRRYVTNDATGEKLGELLRENPRGMLVKRDELSGWLAGLSQQGREQERAFFLEGWNGTGNYTFDRIGRGTIHVPSLTISMFGGIQPGKLRPLIDAATSEAASDDGLLQRFQLLVWPDRLPPWTKPDRYPDKGAADRADAVYTALANATARTWNALGDEDEIPYLRFTPAAQTLYDDWRDELEARVRGDELSAYPAFVSHLSKYRSLMPALALTFHLIALADPTEHRSPAPVDEAPTRLAAAWCDFLEAHARKLYGAELEPGVSEAHALTTKIEAGAIPDGESVRVLYRSQWAGLRTPEHVLAGLNVLVEHGWVRMKTVQSGKQGRPTQIVRLHPELRSATEPGE